MKFLLIIITQVLLFSTILYGQNRSVAITFDDLPGTHGDAEQMEYINTRLLKVLSEENIPSIGFVNESKLHVNDEPDSSYISLIRLWLESGMELGNHTYSHVFINQTTIDEYKDEVRKGEIITRPLMEEFGRELTHFRHPQLRTGPTEEYLEQLNAFLAEENYTIAPVTIDNDEYIYAYCYHEAVERGDQEAQAWIKKDYLHYMSGVFTYYENLSDDFLGYELNQILLLHANLLNAESLDELIRMLDSRDYDFITLEKALTDEAYALPEVQADRGISWLHRWMLAQGIQPDDQPAVSTEIMEMYNRFREEAP